MTTGTPVEAPPSLTSPDFGWANDRAPPWLGFIGEAVRRLVRASAPADILDAGCGNGALCALLAQDGYSVSGIDADKHGIDLVRRAHPGIRFEVGSFARPDQVSEMSHDGRFGCVVSTEVIEHLYAPHELANFAFAVLRPGGTFIVSTPYLGYWKNLAFALLNRWDGAHTALWHGGHIKFWSRRTLTTLLENAGFEVVGFQGVGRVPYLWRFMILVARKPA